jgi:hypothetical protein
MEKRFEKMKITSKQLGCILECSVTEVTGVSNEMQSPE